MEQIVLLAKILAFFVHQSRLKSTEREFGGNGKAALILSQQIGAHSRFMPQELRPLREESGALYKMRPRGQESVTRNKGV